MNKQIIQRVGFVSAMLLVVGAALWLLIAPNAEETKAYITPTGPMSPFDLFKSYETWPNSSTKKIGTAGEWLHTMAPRDVDTTFSDVNGDGLTDILVHQESYTTGVLYYGILLNRGDLTFDLAYKCVHISALNRFYGDCAQ